MEKSSTEKLSASLEDYIEAIFHIVSEKKAARAKDISARLGVTGASVTGALHALSKRKLVNHQPYDVVTLTEAGEEKARDVVRRHKMLKMFFVSVLGIGDEEAEDCACKMEHAVPQNVLNRWTEYMEFTARAPEQRVRWNRNEERFTRG